MAALALSGSVRAAEVGGGGGGPPRGDDATTVPPRTTPTTTTTTTKTVAPEMRRRKKKKNESSTKRGALPSVDDSGSDTFEAREEEEAPVDEEVAIAENEATAEEAAGEIETWTLIQVRWNVFALSPSFLAFLSFPSSFLVIRPPPPTHHTPHTHALIHARALSHMKDGKMADHLDALRAGRRISYLWSTEEGWLDGRVVGMVVL